MIEIMDELIGVLVPIFVCVVLPVSIVWIVFAAIRNGENKRAEVLIKAIENNASIDADRLAEALKPRQKSPREIQNTRLLRGCMFTILGVVFTLAAFFTGWNGDDLFGLFLFAGIGFAIGIAYLIVYFVARKETK